MKLKMAIVLPVALVIELANWFFLHFPIDVGYPPNTPWFIRLIGVQWISLHSLGFFFLVWFEKIAGCHQDHVVMGCQRVDTLVLFVGGFLNTALLVFVFTFCFEEALRLLQQRYPTHKHVHRWDARKG